MSYNEIEYAEKAIEANEKGLILTINNKGDIALTEPVVTIEEIVAQNENRRDALLNDANDEIAVLQRAVKYNLATNEEKERLEKLEIYTVLLSRIDLSTNNIEFPQKPQ